MKFFSSPTKQFAISVSDELLPSIIKSLRYKNYISKVYRKAPSLIIVETTNPSVDVIKDFVQEEITNKLKISEKMFSISE